MTTEATQQGAQQPAEPAKSKAFPDPPIGGVDSGHKTDDDTPVMVNPRDAILENMDARIDAERQSEIHQNQVDLAEAQGLEAPAEPGVATVEPMHDATANPDLPGELQNDPLADFIVMDGDNAMFKTKVDGEERLIPLDTARSQLQKHVAAEIRLQQAAERNKELDTREEQIRQNEATLAQKLEKPAAEASPPSSPDVSDQDLEEEARQVVSGMFRGSEDQAVESLTHLLKKVSQPAGPQIDPAEVANEAVAAARQQLTQEEAEKAEATKLLAQAAAFEQFSLDYKDIMADAALFRYTDGLTDDIELEHPEYTPSQVMTEAGNRTREWVKSMQQPLTSEQDPPPNDRQTRKRNLTPMPSTNSAQRQPAPAEQPDTPQSILDDVRGARGQG